MFWLSLHTNAHNNNCISSLKQQHGKKEKDNKQGSDYETQATKKISVTFFKPQYHNYFHKVLDTSEELQTLNNQINQNGRGMVPDGPAKKRQASLY